MSSAILYLHGFRSAPQSDKVQALQSALSQRGRGDRLFCPQLSHVPAEAIAQAEAIIAQFPDLTVMGSSLGGFYATVLAERHALKAVLINPAIPGALPLEEWIGPHANLYTGVNFDFTAEHVAQLRALDPATVTPQRYWVLLEKGDETLDYRDAVRRYASARQSVEDGGNHRFSRFERYLPQLLAYARLA